MADGEGINTVALVMVVGGFVLIYSAVKNRSTIGIVRNALTGKDIKSAPKINPNGP